MALYFQCPPRVWDIAFWWLAERFHGTFHLRGLSMTTAARLVRIPVFVTSEQSSRSRLLATKYSCSRSEVLRLAIGRGLRDIVPELRRLHREKLASNEADTLSESTALSPPAGGPDVADQLKEYALALRRAGGPRSEAELRLVLTAQAKILRVSPPELDDVVDEVISALPSDGTVEPASDVDPMEPPD